MYLKTQTGPERAVEIEPNENHELKGGDSALGVTGTER